MTREALFPSGVGTRLRTALREQRTSSRQMTKKFPHFPRARLRDPEMRNEGMSRLAREGRVAVARQYVAQAIRDRLIAGVAVSEAEPHGSAQIVEGDEVVPRRKRELPRQHGLLSTSRKLLRP